MQIESKRHQQRSICVEGSSDYFSYKQIPGSSDASRRDGEGERGVIDGLRSPRRVGAFSRGVAGG